MNKAHRPLHLVHLGVSGFPYGFGAIQRILLLCKALQHGGAEVTVINRKSVHAPSSSKSLQMSGEHEGVPYRYTCPQPQREEGFLQRNLNKVRGFLGEIALLRRMKREGRLDGAMLYLTGQFGELLYYRLLTWALGIPMVMSYVEYRSSFPDRSNPFIRLNDWLFDRYCGRLNDAVLPISEYLAEVLRRRAPRTPQIKIPVICDFERFAVEKSLGIAPYFQYVGAASYRELVLFVLQAFERVADAGSIFLDFVLGGKKSELEAIHAYVDTLYYRDQVRIVSNVTDEEIPRRLANAVALLIPLRPSLQDEARFPHKIGEYSASGRPLITTAFGEVKNYFRDGDNALVAAEYEVAQFAEKMRFALEHPEETEAIAARSYEMGLREFNYKTYGAPLVQLFRRLRGEKTTDSPEPAAPAAAAAHL